MSAAPIRNPHWFTPIVAIVALTAIELYALSKGINGVLMTGTMVTIAGIAGFKAHEVFRKER